MRHERLLLAAVKLTLALFARLVRFFHPRFSCDSSSSLQEKRFLFSTQADRLKPLVSRAQVPLFRSWSPPFKMALEGGWQPHLSPVPHALSFSPSSCLLLNLFMPIVAVVSDTLRVFLRFRGQLAISNGHFLSWLLSLSRPRLLYADKISS